MQWLPLVAQAPPPRPYLHFEYKVQGNISQNFGASPRPTPTCSGLAQGSSVLAGAPAKHLKGVLHIPPQILLDLLLKTDTDAEPRCNHPGLSRWHCLHGFTH